MIETTGKIRRFLHGLAHDRDALVQVGKDGVTDGLVAALDAALTAHELVKVKMMREAPVDRHEAAAEAADKTSSVLCGVVGRTFVLYRRHPKKPKIRLPGEPEPKPAREGNPKRPRKTRPRRRSEEGGERGGAAARSDRPRRGRSHR